MKLLALAYKTKAKSNYDKSVLHAFFAPAWAGNHIVEAELHITRNNLLDYNVLVSEDYWTAHQKAHLTIMSEHDYLSQTEAQLNSFESQSFE